MIVEEPPVRGMHVSPVDEPADLDQANRHDDWTPAKGLVRGSVRGSLVALVLVSLLASVAWYVPHVLLNPWVRGSLAFFIAWVLFGVVQRAAGMVGAHCSAIAIGLALLVMLSHHVVFAIHGVATGDGIAIGWEWFHPWALTLVNLTAMVGIAMCTLMRHRGEGGARWLAEILGSGIWSSRR